MAANDDGAVGWMYALRSSLDIYRSVYRVFPDRWEQMYPGSEKPDFGPPAFKTRSGELINHKLLGHLYTYSPGRSGAAFSLMAVPQHVGRTGSRSFLLDESGVVRHCLPYTAADLPTAFDQTVEQSPLGCHGR